MKALNRFLAGLCMIALTGAVIASQRSGQRVNAEAESLRDEIRRMRIGESFPGDTLPSGIDVFLSGVPSEPDDGRPVLLWLVNLETCLGCLAEPQGWNTLAASGLFHAVLAVEGDSVLARRSVVGAVPATIVAFAPPGTIEETLGYPFKSLRVVVGSDGRLIAVDSRVPVGCGNASGPVVAGSADVGPDSDSGGAGSSSGRGSDESRTLVTR